MQNKYILSVAMLLTVACLQAQVPFGNFDTSYVAGSTRIRVASSIKAQVVFRESSNWVRLNRQDGFTAVVPAPRDHDFIAYIPDNTNPNAKGTLMINHERSAIRSERPALGMGGAMSVVPVIRTNDTWKIDNSIATGDTCFAVDFSTVGYTTTNCGGAVLSTGNVLTGEEIFANFRSNFQIRNNFDTLLDKFGYDGRGNYTIPATVPDFGGRKIKMFQNFGWLTEVDPKTRRAVRKLYHAGRMSFEGTTELSDRRTLVHGNDFVPNSSLPDAAFLYKYVADVAGDFSQGNLYVFKQNPGSYEGVWMKIPRVLDSLLVAPQIAKRMGATMFQRLEWTCFDPVSGKVFIAETGRDKQSMVLPMRGGATVPKHWMDKNLFNTADSVCEHPYGAVLVLENALTDKPSVRVHLWGGPEVEGNPAASKFVFNSVDGITLANYGKKRFLVLQEDNIGGSLGRIVPSFVGDYPFDVPKAFMLDLDIPNPTPANLNLFYTGSRNSEATGAVLTPDGSTCFINNQHPDGTGRSFSEDTLTSPLGNVYPFQRASTLALVFDPAKISEVTALDNDSEEFLLYPNPVFKAVNFNKIVDIELYNSQGQLIRTRQQVAHVNVDDLQPGMYFVRTTHNNKTYRIIVER
jgi:secreted PhoX family phosphatase